MADQFQSLFSWMLRSKLYPAVLENQIDDGFNPCSRGCCARRCVHKQYLMMLSVSILVLVDVALEADYDAEDYDRLLSFNPCSRGCCARRPDRRTGNCAEPEFQSLFSWMLRSKHLIMYCITMSGLFQSLFSWMLRSKQEKFVRDL